MPRKFLTLFGGLPDFCALMPMVWCLSYGATIMVVGSRAGRQSSTTGIAVGLAIIGAPLLGAVGLGLGRLAVLVVGPTFPSRWVRIARWCSPVLLLAIAVAASLQASGPILAAEREAVPRVISNLTQLHRQTDILRMDSVKRASRVYDELGKVNQAIPWGDSNAYLTNLGNALEVRFAPSGSSLRIPLPGIDYINFVDAIALKMDSSARPALALLITGRATGRRDLLAVVSGSGELVYLELLDRFWDYLSVPLAIAPSSAGDQILVGSDPQNLLVFATAEPGN